MHQANPPLKSSTGNMKHVLFKTGDKGVPDAIMDRNGEVVLGLCRICGLAEIELSQPCAPGCQWPLCDLDQRKADFCRRECIDPN